MNNQIKYCHDCGSENLKYKEAYGCGDHYVCEECGKELCFQPEKYDDMNELEENFEPLTAGTLDKCTDGEWVEQKNPLSKNGQRIIKSLSNNAYIAYVASEDLESDEEVEANACMMAASKKMHEALEHAKMELEDALRDTAMAFTKDSDKINNFINNHVCIVKINAALDAAKPKR